MILVKDLDRARETYQRLGFTLTPRGFHSLGSQNHCIMFGHDYLELMALPVPPPTAFQYFAQFLAKGEGAGALALATEDALAAREALLQAGVAAEPPLSLSRPIENLGEARFTLVQLPPAATPGFRSFVCQHHTRDVVWRPENQRHANGAQGIESVVIATAEPTAYRRLFDGLPVTFSRTDVGKSRRGGPAIGAVRVRVSDKDAAGALLKGAGFRPVQLKDGALVVPADQAHGVMLVFC